MPASRNSPRDRASAAKWQNANLSVRRVDYGFLSNTSDLQSRSMATTSGGTTSSRCRRGREGRTASGPFSTCAIASGKTRGLPLIVIAGSVPRRISARTNDGRQRQRRLNSLGVKACSSTKSEIPAATYCTPATSTIIFAF